jgi:hypothetical protein
VNAGGAEGSRRALCLGIFGAILAEACGGSPAEAPAKPAGPVYPPFRVASVADLLTAARLRWAVLARPREIASVPFLIPPISKVVSEEALDRFTAASAVDLRQLPEAAVASYAWEEREITFYIARHTAEPAAVERAFLARLSGKPTRVAERPDLVRVSGKIGITTRTLVLIGRDIVGFQDGGSVTRGPARIAALYATDKIKKTPTLLAEEPLKSLHARFGPAPLRALALGPFEGELARGARGLLAGATAIGAAARPSAREGVALSIAVSGDFSKSGEAASKELSDAWQDLAGGSFGRLLGLDKPVEGPLATFSPQAVAVAVELEPRKLAAGLADATSARIQDIMR